MAFLKKKPQKLANYQLPLLYLNCKERVKNLFV